MNRTHLFFKEKIKTYLKVSIIFCFIFFLSYRRIFECYAFSDDYSLLYYVSHENFVDYFIASGRPIYGLMVKCIFLKLYYICDLKYARILSFVGILIFSVLLFRAYVLAGWNRVEGACAALITCLMPAFGLYSAWATTFPFVYGAALSFIAGELCLKSYNCLLLKTKRIKITILMLGSAFLIMISFMIYQPAATAFWLFIAIALFKPYENNNKLLRNFLFCFVIFTISVMVYFIWYKATIWPFTIEPLDRSGLTNNFLEKIHWFVKNPFCDALSLFSILQEKVVISITIAGVSIIIIIGMFRRIWRSTEQGWQFAIIFLCLLPLSYLPNLASIESWSAFRTQGVLGSLVLFYLLLSLKEICQSSLTNIIFLCLLSAFSLMAYKNVTYGFVEPQKQELKILRNALNEPLSQQKKEIIFIRPHWKDSLALKLRYDEYGLPSTYHPCVHSLINLIAREISGISHNLIKVHNYRHDETFTPKEGIPVINAGELLRGFKQIR